MSPPMKQNNKFEKRTHSHGQEEGAHSTRSRWIDACEFHDKSNFISYYSPVAKVVQ